MAPSLALASRIARLPPWARFILSGSVAPMLGAIAVYLVHAPLWVIFVLLPPAICSFDPSPLTLTQEILKTSLVFGGSFLLYGTAGWLARDAIADLRSWKRERSERP